jgi:hypothetical protein
MTNALLQIKIKERLNKLASFDYDNLECWQMMEAFNKGQIEWVRRQVHGANQFKEGDESSKINIDDLQILETNTLANPIVITKKDGYYETNLLPKDYLYYKRFAVKSVASCCPTPRRMIVYLSEFELTQPVLYYYRKPKEVLIKNCVNPSTGETITEDQLCEFKDDIVEILIDEACTILAGDIESITQYQRNKDNSTSNT